MHVGYMIKSRFSATSLCLGIDTEQRSWCGTPKGTRMRSVTLNDPMISDFKDTPLFDIRETVYIVTTETQTYSTV